MKTLYTLISVLCLTLIGFCACTDDTSLQDIHPEIQNNDFVTLSLNYELLNDKEIIVTRSAATAPEKKLYDLHFYIFNEDGNLTGYEKVLPTNDNDVIEEAHTTEQVTIRAKSGTSYIYAVANINESTTYYLDASDLALLNINEGNSDEEYRINIENSQLTKEKFLSIQFNRMHGDENKLFSPDPMGNVFVMSGYANDGKSVNIPNSMNGNVSLPNGQNIVKLYRILAKNTFKVVSGITKGTFTPKYYRLCNVPIGGTLMPKAGIGTSSYGENNVTTAEVESSFRWNFDGNEEITFYYPENLQNAKNNNISQWKDREKNSWANGVKTFTNAADNAAYIEIVGEYVDNAGKVSANVSYSIHFGNFSSANTLNDFNVIRNHSYEYKVTVDGVNDIKVEAQTTTGEDNPYVEGVIVDAEGGVHFDIDAHYEARVMTFKKKTIQSLKELNSGYVLTIKTPFGETKQTVCVKNGGVWSIGGDRLCDINNVTSLFNNEADYKWAKFVKNTDNNRIDGRDKSKNICRYPGDNSGDVLNVFQLLDELYDDSNYTENGNSEVYYTCFIDEYYYANKSWPEYVDKDPRSMLIANDLNVSADGKSIYAKVAYSISQRSITTFYTTDYIYPGTEKLVKAFGTEIIDEEELNNIRFNNDNYRGFRAAVDWKEWENARDVNKNQGWYHEMRHAEGKQPLYTTVARACMSRNRDLNGNNQIDENEVRWYLAGIDQYRALFFGQNALAPDAYLIKRSEQDDIDAEFKRRNNNWGGGDDYMGHKYRGRYHYYTSSGGIKATFWPEEGLTNNPITGDGINWTSTAELVRCIRTLESNGVGTKNPDPFYSYNNNTFEMGGIKATRNYTEAPLEGHNEIQPANNLYSSFVVAKYDLENGKHYQLADLTSGGADPCRNYSKQDNVRNTDEANYTWRTPNQKELALMVSRVTEMANHRYGTRTRFSGDDEPNGYWNWHDTAGFWSDQGSGGRINVGSGYNDNDGKSLLRVRCVRDKK